MHALFCCVFPSRRVFALFITGYSIVIQNIFLGKELLWHHHDGKNVQRAQSHSRSEVYVVRVSVAFSTCTAARPPSVLVIIWGTSIQLAVVSYCFSMLERYLHVVVTTAHVSQEYGVLGIRTGPTAPVADRPYFESINSSSSE